MYINSYFKQQCCFSLLQYLCYYILLCVQIEENAVKFKIAPRKHESILNIVFANYQRPPNNLVSMTLSHCYDCLLCGTLP